MARDESQVELLRQAFRMPSGQTMASRKSSITNAFVIAIIPIIMPTIDEIAEALEILDMAPDDVRCAYCGDLASEWDHLRPLVLNRKPTGYISEIGNLVPSCGKCNQSKGNKPWEAWIRSDARWSPARRCKEGLEGRIARLRRYQEWKPIEPIDLAEIVGADHWREHWENLDAVVELLTTSQKFADHLKRTIMTHHNPVGQGKP